ncbi:MAG: N-6 DNA methylase [Candidatus Sericytochromatia bacterium]|nr:N-6 DNA methylase [Candidatus Sericytochromatia bacterium]
MASIDPQILNHLEWLGFVQPTGLVVSAPALVRAGAILDRRDIAGQQALKNCLAERFTSAEKSPEPYLPDFVSFAQKFLGWRFSPNGYAGMEGTPIPEELKVTLADYRETLSPDFAVKGMDTRTGSQPWQLVVTNLETGTALDKVERRHGHLEASAHGRMERLLRQTGVPAGLIFNGTVLRLISAPRGESSGWIDFKVADMLQTAGRPIATALRLLLKESRLLSVARHQRLAALLESSRKFQNEVSERLAEQVLHGLYELLRGFQAAHEASGGELLRQTLTEHPDEVYRSLLTVMLRIVFLLFAEERDMLPEEETFLRYYSLAGLYNRLREDAALYPDTMDQRFGAWAQLLVLFRMIHDGAKFTNTRLPARHGVLFDPDRFPFLEGRPTATSRQLHERIEPPLVPDGTIYRLLEKLLVLDGERISYRALDVEQIGSVYETMMGFRLETAIGRSVAIKAEKKHGAPTTLDLEKLLAESVSKRDKWIEEKTGKKTSATVKKALKEANTLEALHAALQTMIDLAASPDLIQPGAMVLQPSEERRKSGSHYTPRSLTEPIVRKTLEPILAHLRQNGVPKPEEILALKVCDPAMGSGAFLVEVCRQLGDALIEAWYAHDALPTLPPDEDEVVFARRLVAQRCLYGVDRNPVAVDLAKVSLWLVTLAREHALTFVDHALRHGDSLVGLSCQQIESLHWKPNQMPILTGFGVQETLQKVSQLRQQIQSAEDALSDRELRDLWDQTQFELRKLRLFGDLIVAAFFEGNNARTREDKRNVYSATILNQEAENYQGWLDELRQGDKPLVPFHWEIEFPEVFGRANPGFDAFVGNPPFAGKNTMASANQPAYPDWLKEVHTESHGNADLVAHFFRRAFNLLRHKGAMGLIATKTIAEGDTRSTGLRWICIHGGDIYKVVRRIKWPGIASRIVSVVCLIKGIYLGTKVLDNREVDKITAFLFHGGGNHDPVNLRANAGKSFQGSTMLGMGFTFDDTDRSGVANSLADMRSLIAKDPVNQQVIFPYIGYSEVASTPSHSYHRYAINFGNLSEIASREMCPDLMDIIEKKVRPERLAQNDVKAKEKWWQYTRPRLDLYSSISGLKRVLVVSTQAAAHFVFAFIPNGMVYANSLAVLTIQSYSGFAVIQSTLHELWTRFLCSSMKDDLRYNPSDCFETYPFPSDWETSPALETAGQAYYEYRAQLMVQNNQGLTETYNRFHNPEESDAGILQLRELHMAMDRAVLVAYGWEDISTECQFLLDYEEEEETSSRRKKPWRYRWPDDVHDEVLARLLELNAQRAKEEALQIGRGKAKEKKPRQKKETEHPPEEIHLEDYFT